MKIALAIITMALGLLFAFSESPTMIPNFLGAIAFLMACIVLGNLSLAIITMALGLIFAFSESPTMIPNVLGAIAFLMSGIVVGNCIYRRLR